MKRVYAFCDFETTGLFQLSKPDPYPIEVGLIFTDENYTTITTYQNLIGWDGLINKSCGFQWPSDYQEAYKIHGITPEEYLGKSEPFQTCGRDIIDICESLKIGKYYPTLISDNIQFEYRLMWNLFLHRFQSNPDNEEIFPFHYCGFDTSEFLIRSGVGDPKPEHRAFRDAALLQQHMIRAVEKLTGFKES